MKLASIIALLAGSLIPWFASRAAMVASDVSNSHPVIVELFTSEGCSSCPPADELLLRLDQQQHFGNVDVIVLGEHVDYWDHLGWNDRFSSAAFTQRQRMYAESLKLRSVYTPQVVIDGKLEGVGNDAAEMREKLGDAAKSSKPAQVLLKLEQNNNLRIGIAYRGSGSPRVLLAVTEKDTTTHVGSGENGGRTLHHAPVVRELKSIGKVENGKFTSAVAVPMNGSWKAPNLRAVVFVQDSESLEILGAAQIYLSGAQ